MTKKYTKEELAMLAEIRLHRLHKEQSRAMPRRYYGDPAKVLEAEQERKGRGK